MLFDWVIALKFLLLAMVVLRYFFLLLCMLVDWIIGLKFLSLEDLVFLGLLVSLVIIHVS